MPQSTVCFKQTWDCSWGISNLHTGWCLPHALLTDLYSVSSEDLLKAILSLGTFACLKIQSRRILPHDLSSILKVHSTRLIFEAAKQVVRALRKNPPFCTCRYTYICIPLKKESLKDHSLCKIEWKLKRGTWRPKLLDFAKSVSDEEIQTASRAAFSVLASLGNATVDSFAKTCEAALEPLVKIKVQIFHACIAHRCPQVCCAIDRAKSWKPPLQALETQLLACGTYIGSLT